MLYGHLTGISEWTAGLKKAESEIKAVTAAAMGGAGASHNYIHIRSDRLLGLWFI